MQKETGRKEGKSVNFDITLSAEQKTAKEGILSHPFSFIMGRAGSGKTLLAAAVALDKLFKKEISKIVIARPTVSTEDNGFMPGGVMEKMEHWIVPIIDNLKTAYAHPENIAKYISEGKIEIVPLTFFRGRTMTNAVCIIDEFQNITKPQLSMAVGRLGLGSIMIFTGDKDQIDLRFPEDSAIHLVSKIQDSEYVYTCELTDNHRHPAVKELLERLST
jgi:phosphate starvation-inducible PhoH-like protein